MREMIRPEQRIDHAGPAGLGDVFSAAEGQAGMALVTHSVYAEHLPVGGMTVGQIRRRYRDRFNIEPGSQAILEGNAVGDDTIVGTSQTLTFRKRGGVKGNRR